MKRQRINVKEVCEAYNKARTQNQGKKGDSKWITQILKSFGISGVLAGRMLSQSALFQQFVRTGQGRGRHLGYIFPTNPVHFTWFENWLYPVHKNNAPVKKEQPSFEEECIKHLEGLGYVIEKVEFNERAFREAYPDLWRKFLIRIK